MTHLLRTGFLFLLTGLTACEPWNLEPRRFPTCDLPSATIATSANRLTVQFGLANQTGTADAIRWDFGDGTSSTIFSIVHFYPRAGTFPVTARLTNICGDDVLISSTVTVNNAVLPTVSTLTPSDFTSSTAKLSLLVNSLGNDALSAYGVLISSTQLVPTLANASGIPGTGQPVVGATYTVPATSLQKGRAYYVRAYATNSAGTGYGEVKSFSL